MGAFLYGIALQFRLDIRSKSLLITCYIVPLMFFAIMGGIFTSLMPEAKDTLISSMTVMGVSMGALIGVPPSLAEIYGSDIKKVYKANGMPLCFGLLSLILSAFIHLLIMSSIIYILSPIAFDAQIPSNLPLYFGNVIVFILVSLSIACVLGLSIKSQAKLTMFSQLVFLPSIMLSGIMFPANLLPEFLQIIGKLLPAAWSYTSLSSQVFELSDFIPLMVIFSIAIALCAILLKKLRSE
ncbi:ABC transporter permease [Ihubacter massiliensis]|uniref:ABC transporter permease n=1 Tax=Hominibacterium faecale TaxID=2839743 RepID=A0A9J6QP01_9FIRM|nr:MULTISPECIES: ABC transporter permease [Eubacteriales Family XIII. Incertae Sedis]MCI7304282.1 ABC transporter permease [Clostridia bacterium]MDE8731613.1 ABC transporter permease [Eubacteriales bacterium DFI.9.88]MDY3010977.1 ABC transporter permease [Clostridiales Family XIII bacterium]MCO7122875.1 ABC transporter permease [Ihubacter massiliensis]MCU7377148.1 ABC transporter permease [Hominibacterium faecale]